MSPVLTFPDAPPNSNLLLSIPASTDFEIRPSVSNANEADYLH